MAIRCQISITIQRSTTTRIYEFWYASYYSAPASFLLTISPPGITEQQKQHVAQYATDLLNKFSLPDNLKY